MATTDNLNHFDHDVGSTLDYEIDWGPYLDVNEDGDSIASATSAPQSGLTLGPLGTVFDGRLTHTWCSTCSAGNTYYVRVTIVTSKGRTDTRTFYIDAKLL